MFRRFSALLLVLTLVFSSVGATVHAQSDFLYVEDVHINPLYQDTFLESDLAPVLYTSSVADAEYTGSAKTLARTIRENMKHRNNTINLHINTADAKNAEANKAAVKALVNEAFALAIAHTGVPIEGDYLKWQYGGWEYGGKGHYADDGSINWDIPFSITYYTTAAQEQEMDIRVAEVLEELDVRDGNEYEIILAVYDYICANVTYDYENLEIDEYRLKNSAYAALINKTAVCQGYALLFYRLCLELGVDTRLIAGDGGGPHGWNIARIGEYYYNVDSTWDAGKTSYDYFLRCPSNFKNHTRYAEYDTLEFHTEYPMASEDFDPSGLPCSHRYMAAVTKEADCWNDGIRTYTCGKCGDQYTEAIPALGHQVISDKGYAPSCTETGLTDGTHCGRCGTVLEVQMVISALGHSWDEGTVTKEPTEEETGILTFTCTVCQETRTESIPELSHTHRYTPSVIAPTCTEEGYTLHTCRCGDSYITDETPALGHSWDDGAVTKEPTEKEPGVFTYTCTVCQETRTEPIPVLEHTHRYTAVVTAPTCTEEGFTTLTCSCGDFYIAEKVPALGHSWDEGTVTKEPTEEEPGICTFTCTACGEIRTDLIPQLEHTHQYTSIVTAPTCTEDGYTTHTCRCGDSYITDETPAPGHSWDAGSITREPTEETPGIKTFTCTVCQETRTEELPFVPELKIARVYGADRCATAIEAAKELKKVLGVKTFDTIIIASGDGFADALTGSYLASAKDAPILLYRKSATAANQAFILENLSEDGVVYVLGGTLAIPESFITDLNSAGIRTQRLSGDTRFSTNLKVLETAGVDNQEILIATGWDFADSLSASATGLPILMVNTTTGELTNEQLEFLQAHSKNAYTIIGGENAVSARMEALIEQYVNADVKRVSGTTREATSVAVAEHYFSNPEVVFLAFSRDFPDGLCGGPLSHALGAPLLLINNRTEAAARDYIRQYEIYTGYILGGPVAISDDSIAIAFDLAQ